MIRPLTTGLLFVILLSIVIAIPSDTSAFDQRLYKGGFGVKGGFMYVTTVHLHNRHTGADNDYRTKAGLAGGVFFDIPLHRKTMLGLDIELYDIQIDQFDVLDLDDRTKLINFSLDIKHTIAAYKQSRIAVRPGLGVGYGYLAEIGPIERASFVLAKAFTELLFVTDPKIIWVLEASIVMTPYGRTDDYKITANPFLMLRGGARF
jgi:hypothetical protein